MTSASWPWRPTSPASRSRSTATASRAHGGSSSGVLARHASSFPATGRGSSPTTAGRDLRPGEGGRSRSASRVHQPRPDHPALRPGAPSLVPAHGRHHPAGSSEKHPARGRPAPAGRPDRASGSGRTGTSRRGGACRRRGSTTASRAGTAGPVSTGPSAACSSPSRPRRHSPPSSSIRRARTPGSSASSRSAIRSTRTTWTAVREPTGSRSWPRAKVWALPSASSRARSRGSELGTRTCLIRAQEDRGRVRVRAGNVSPRAWDARVLKEPARCARRRNAKGSGDDEPVALPVGEARGQRGPDQVAGMAGRLGARHRHGTVALSARRGHGPLP